LAARPQTTGQLTPRSRNAVIEVDRKMEPRQIVGLTGVLVLFIGVFTPIVSIPTVGYINYVQNEKLDGVIVLSLAVASFVLLLTKQYRALWFTGFASLGVLLFTFIKLQIRISEIKEKFGADLAGKRAPRLADWAMQSVQIEWGWPVLTIGAAFILWAAAQKFGTMARVAAYRRERSPAPSPVAADPNPAADDPLLFTYMCPKCQSFQKSDVLACGKCGTRNPHRPNSFSHSETREDPGEYHLAIEELNGLIGLSTVKHEIETLANLVRVQKMREAHGFNAPTMSLHLVFTGNPGTGKTTVARLLGRIYKGLGVLASGHVVEVERRDLVAAYVGQTAMKTMDVISKSLDGVLFIDEAYALAKRSENDYGQEAIETLLTAMEDNRDRLVVVVAGYSQRMREFIESNPGLQSRFNKYIEFPDYSIEELITIFEKFVAQNQYLLSEDGREEVEKILERERRESGANFANARLVRNVFEIAIEHQANRVAAIASPCNDDLQKITREDLVGIDIPN
jgi:stage V sporulation protein K